MTSSTNSYITMENSKRQQSESHLFFYTEVNGWDSKAFLRRLHYLENEVRPSLITIHINSCGGSCVEGIGIFAAVRNSPVRTRCIIDGIAASMASVIWAAGDELYMRDYALLMIHNPFLPDSDDDSMSPAVTAFRNQLMTIYMRRFGFSEEKATEIMNGDEGMDGTFFTAAEAVREGFLPQDHVIHTPQIINFKNFIMDKKNLREVAAMLGMDAAAADDEALVCAKISETMEQMRAQMQEKDTLLAGSTQTVANLHDRVKALETEVDGYRKEREQALQAEIDSVVDEAIRSCKIEKAMRADWVTMAQANLPLVKKVLDSIPGKVDIRQAIAADPDNQQMVRESMKDAEALLQEKVDAVVGKDFKFLK